MALIWKSEKEQLSDFEQDKKTRDRKLYGIDGYVLAAEGKFYYKGVAYLIKVLRYFTFTEGFKALTPDRISDMHAVVEAPMESEHLVELVREIGYDSDFLYHDTLHTFNDKQTIEKQIEVCHEWAKRDIDELQLKIKEKLLKILELQKLLNKLSKEAN